MFISKILYSNQFRNCKNNKTFLGNTLKNMKLKNAEALKIPKTHDELAKTTIDSIEVLNKNQKLVEKIADNKFIAKLSDFVNRFF